MPFVAILAFSPPILVEELGQVFSDVPKFVLRQDSSNMQNSCHPDSSSPNRRISSFIFSLNERSQCSRILCFAATLASRSQIGIGRLRLSSFEIPFRIICSKFDRCSTLTIGFSFPCTKNSILEER
ncbi:hypothetical protein AVEN_250943-1 [Araneus ventricosus]|uniref:Uncharacterized protein n=1 Tax=Araneus ventricosus TaxID=182803 RepID=A0A4Y2TML2_ARAVE|nr:hypothetical protein AVEN_250943-1 [Araneus ventricosus]